MNRARALRIGGLGITVAIALASGLAVYRYPTDLAIGSPGLGSLAFWLVASAPLAFYAATLLRSKSPMAVAFTAVAVALSFLWVAAAWAVGGEGIIFGVGLSPIAFWVLCGLNYLLIAGFRHDT